MCTLMKVVSSSVAIANRAGNSIRNVLRSGDLAVVDKGENGKIDPQTAADRLAQSIIIGSLKKQYPGMLVIGEEEGFDEVSDDLAVTELDPDVLKHHCPNNYSDLTLNDLVVWVDPLDGTREFTEGFVEHVTVLIGISAHGKAIAGVIHQPFHKENSGRTMWGVVGLGTFGISLPNVDPKRRIIVTTKSHMTQDVVDTIGALEPDEVKRVGGCGYKVMQVMEGGADAYVFSTPGTKKWDTCAPESLLKASGGTMTDICGVSIDYTDTSQKSYMNWTGLLATRRDHESYLSKVPDVVKKSLQEKKAEKTK